MKSFLVAYDFGTGGLWAILNAESKDQITKRFPDLTILEQRPDSMSETDYGRITAQETYALSGPLPQWLADLDKK
ncbi:hypothetical protein [Ferrovibrio terrae]|uniref:hypothetical protein n=1 Tax=Ferrovibrio terrae TaxID=2594003 RepID=UPI0031382554